MTTVFFVSLILSTFLCALVTGFVFTYAVVVMPGLKQLSDKEFIRAFQVTDAIIQNNHPFFMMVWLGSIISVSGAIVMAFTVSTPIGNWSVIATGFSYLLGVQGLTIFIHLPLNKRIQSVNVNEMNPKALLDQRVLFEARWTRFNKLRALIACMVTASFIIILGLGYPIGK